MKKSNLSILSLTLLATFVFLTGHANADSIAPADVQLWQFSSFDDGVDYSFNIKFFNNEGEAKLKIYQFSSGDKEKRFEFENDDEDESSSFLAVKDSQVRDNFGTTPFFFQFKYEDNDEDNDIKIYKGYEILGPTAGMYTLSFKNTDGALMAEVTGLKASPVPLPGTGLLFASVLAGFGIIRRKKRAL